MRKLLCSILSFCALTLSAQTVVQPFALKEVKLLPSRFQRNMQRDSAWIASIPVNRLLHSFRNTAGVYSALEGGYDAVLRLGGWESLDCDLRGHITGHLLSAMAYLASTATVPSGSPLGLKADSLINGLAEVQRQYGTGYLSAFGEGLIDRNIQGKSVWAPFYTLHKILQGLIDQYRLCGNVTALEVAKGMGNWAYNKLSPLDEETRRRMIRNEFGGFNDAMYQLYAITHDERYLWVARFFYHNEKIDPLKQGNMDLGTNHANTFIPKLMTEGPEVIAPFFWTLVNDHAFVTGEISDKEHLFKPSEQSKHLTGYDGENCCTYNLLKLADRLFTYQPDSKIADYYERALYNHILGQQDTLTSMVCYFTPLMTGGYRLYSTRDSSWWCCVGSGFESHAKYQSSIYFHNDKELYVNLFIPSELNWNGTIVRQETRFPESNNTTLTITVPNGSPLGLTLNLRYPKWASYMKINGKKAKPGKDGYVAIRATSRVEVEFGMALHEEAVKDDPSRVALLYGPIVLAGRLGEVIHPFSDPTKHNDYYTFDYGKHPDVTLGTIHSIGNLHYQTGNIPIAPFYDMQHCRYVVYWKK